MPAWWTYSPVPRRMYSKGRTTRRSRTRYIICVNCTSSATRGTSIKSHPHRRGLAFSTTPSGARRAKRKSFRSHLLPLPVCSESETQLKVELPRDVEATRVSTRAQAVPRRIYQTNKSANVSKKTLDNVRHMLSINPEWSYHFYDDARCELFFEEHAATTLAFAGDVMSAWRRLKAGAAKADFWRYCVLYTYGGLYLDLDSGINRPLDDLLTASDQGLWQFDEDANLIQWVLIHVPRDVVLGKVIALSTERVLAGEPNIYLATGPHLLNDAYLHHHTGFKVYDANSGMSKERRLEICVRSGARHEDRDTFAMVYAHYAATDIYSCRSERYTPGWNRRTPGLYWDYK